jgi:hypothetical protein
MRQRGRKSSAALAAGLVVIAERRPDPPAELTPEQADAFRGIVDRLPRNFFSHEQIPLVGALARHLVTARRLGAWVDQLETVAPSSEGFFDGDLYMKVLAERRKESATIKSLMTALRLTPQSRYRPETARAKAEGARGPAPWETGDGETPPRRTGI